MQDFRKQENGDFVAENWMATKSEQERTPRVLPCSIPEVGARCVNMDN